MIISCPACESRFKIDPDRIPAAGRQVRCGKCEHLWRIAVDGAPVAVAADIPPAPDPAVAGFSAGESAPAVDEAPGEEGAAPAPSMFGRATAARSNENGAGDVGTAAQSGQGEAPADAETAAVQAPPVMGPAMSPTARQKLAEARRGRSRVRFLVIALVLLIVSVVAVSFIRRPDGVNDALRMVPGLETGTLDENAAGEKPSDENTGGGTQ